MSERRARVSAIVALLSISSGVAAHHSTASYDYSKSVKLTGTVKEFFWTNPHMFIVLLSFNDQGKELTWNVECGTPNINVRHGWKKSDLNAGDKVSMAIHPMRDGSLSGTLMTVTLADGRLLYGAGHDIKAGPPPPGAAPSRGAEPNGRPQP
jgi:hypothetical protein